MEANRAAAIVFLLLAAVLGTVLFRMAGPAAKPASAPFSEFSAERAIALLHDISGGDTPHPIGTPAHDAVLERLIRGFEKAGYTPVVQRAFACNPSPTCAPLANVIVELPGDARAETLLVTAHYDSVAAGPGASDDGIGVAAIVEIARAVRNEHFRNTILFVITDGEEAGLLGAQALMNDPLASRGATLVINVENRGTRGSSLLFETSRHNRWLIQIVARALPRPATNSLMYEAYELLPNDTDLTVFKHAGLAAVNFAAVGGVAHYHTPRDNLANVSPALVQGHGDHLLAMTRAFANADLRQSTDDNAVYFDVLSMKTIWWPQAWTMQMTAIILIALLIGAALRIRSGDTNIGSITLGILSFFASILIAAVFALLAAWIVGLRDSAANWSSQPGPSITAAWLIGIGAAIVVATRIHAHSGFDGLFIGHAICWSAVAIALAKFLPGASYIAVVPAAAFALSVLLLALIGAEPAIGSMICAVTAAVLHFPLTLLFYDAFGRPAIVVIAVMIALVSTTFTPIVVAANSVRRAALPAILVTAIVCIAMQLAISGFTPQSPRRLNVRYVDDGKTTRWEADALTPRLRRAAAFRTSRLPLPWSNTPSTVHGAPAPRLDVPAPEVRVVSREGRHVVLQIRSPRKAQRMSLTFHTDGVAGIKVNGITPPAAGTRYRASFAPGWHRVVVRAAEEATIDLFLQKDGPIDAIVSDYSFGLPPEGRPIAAARDASTAVPSDEGDGVLITRRVRL